MFTLDIRPYYDQASNKARFTDLKLTQNLIEISKDFQQRTPKQCLRHFGQLSHTKIVRFDVFATRQACKKHAKPVQIEYATAVFLDNLRALRSSTPPRCHRRYWPKIFLYFQLIDTLDLKISILITINQKLCASATISFHIQSLLVLVLGSGLSSPERDGMSYKTLAQTTSVLIIGY